ncbi:GNAT family N-acetyltransferase [Effusibacillus consociatus]|uniref:GNAT family N-acetyltransferase n=1 Tax=Effusibacillus consociatus TaxID=1117041 RepID=A0ABV9Q7J0_9BACL
MSLNIRPARHEDIPQVVELMFQYIVDFYKRPRPSEESLQGLVTRLLENPASGIQFVAEQDGPLIGFATLYFTFSTLQVKKAAILNDLFVLPSVRGQKVGEQLFQTCLSYIREYDFAYMTWETAKDNLAAQSLYEKMGGQRSNWLQYEIS